VALALQSFAKKMAHAGLDRTAHVASKTTIKKWQPKCTEDWVFEELMLLQTPNIRQILVGNFLS